MDGDDSSCTIVSIIFFSDVAGHLDLFYDNPEVLISNRLNFIFARLRI